MKLSALKLKLPFSRYQIWGHSMEPTLHDGQIVWVNTWYFWIKSPQRGQIVVFQQGGKILVKRVTKVGQNKVSLAGDNQKDSYDSGVFGEVDKKFLLGKVIE